MTTTAFDREWRVFKERLDILWGARGAAGRPERAVRLKEIGDLSAGTGGGLSMNDIRAGLLIGEVNDGDTTHAPTGDAVHDFVMTQVGALVSSVNGMTGAVVLNGIAYYYGSGLPTGGTYANGDRAFDTDTGREYTYVDGAWLDMAGSGGLGARTTVAIASGSGAVTIGKSAVLVELQASAAARCRFYCTAAARDADAARAAGTEVPQGAGLILEFIATDLFLGAPLTPAPVAYNLDGPVAGALYYNIEPVGGAMTVGLTYLPLGN